MLALARPIDDAAHHRDVQGLDARITGFPFGHRVANERLDVARQFLERGGSRAAAARASRYERQESAESHGLQQFLADLHFDRAVAAGFRGERNTDRVADALL